MRKTDIPLYEMTIDALTEGGKEATGFDKIAYVSDPAIEEMGVLLSANDLIVEETLLKLSNEEKQQVVAPLLIPNKLIPRNDRGFYHISFSLEVIQQLKDKADSEGKLSSLNIMKDTHRGGIAPSFVLEDWIIEDENDKAYTEYGFDINKVPIGSWMVITQVIDKDFWEKEIKQNKKFAYSIEAFMNMKMINLKLNKIEMEEENKEAMLEAKIAELEAKLAEKEVKAEDEIKVDEEVEAEEEVIKVDEKEELEEEVVVDEEVKAEDEIKVEEEVKAEDEVIVDEKEELEEEDKFEAIYEEIAKLKTLISELMEANPIEDKVEMGRQGSVHQSIVALRNLRNSNR